MSQADRAQQFVERIQEDERLRGDLGDTAATALVHWAIEQTTRAAADPQRSDDDLARVAQAIRSAARAAARSGAEDAAAVIAKAEGALAEAGVLAPAPAAPPAEASTPAAEAAPAAVLPTTTAIASAAASTIASTTAAPAPSAPAVEPADQTAPPTQASAPADSAGGAPGLSEAAGTGRAVRRRSGTPPVSPPNRRRWSDRMIKWFRGTRKDV